jgi:hypothetical protein
MLKEALPSHNGGLEGQDKRVTHKGEMEQKECWKEAKNSTKKICRGLQKNCQAFEICRWRKATELGFFFYTECPMAYSVSCPLSFCIPAEAENDHVRP